VRSKALSEKLGETDCLPTVSDTKTRISYAVQQMLGRHLQELKTQYAKDKKLLEKTRKEMVTRHHGERENLLQQQSKRRKQESLERASRFRSGLRGLWDRVTGKHAAIAKRNAEELRLAENRDRSERETLFKVQLRSRQSVAAKFHELREESYSEFSTIKAEQKNILGKTTIVPETENNEHFGRDLEISF